LHVTRITYQSSAIHSDSINNNWTAGTLNLFHFQYDWIFTGQHDRQDESLTSQIHNQSGHCPLTGRYFEPWKQSYLELVYSQLSRDNRFSIAKKIQTCFHSLITCLLSHISKSFNIKFSTQCYLPAQSYLRYCKIPKIGPGLFIYLWTGLHSVQNGKFAYLNRLG